MMTCGMFLYAQMVCVELLEKGAFIPIFSGGCTLFWWHEVVLHCEVRHFCAKDYFLQPVEVCLEQDDGSQLVEENTSELFLKKHCQTFLPSFKRDTRRQTRI